MQGLIDKFNFNSVHGRYNTLTSPPSNYAGDSNWSITEGEVVIVNPADHTCRVHTDDGRDLHNVMSVSPWFSFGTGAGMYFYPEAGSRVVLGKSFNGTWYILGYVPLKNVQAEAPLLNGKRDIREGDACISTAFGNYIEIRKTAGCITLHNTEVCKMILDSKENQLFIHTQRLKIVNQAGSIEMTTDTQGNTVTVGYFRQKLDDNKNFVKIMMGSVGLVNSTRYAVGPDGEKSSPPIIFSINISNKASLTVDTEGNVISYCKSAEHRVEEDSETVANGNIIDRSASDILHYKMSTSELSGVQDEELQDLNSYSPTVGSAAPPPGGMTPVSPTQGRAMPAGEDTPPEELGQAPAPSHGGSIVCQTQSVSPNDYKRSGVMTIYDSDGAVLGSYKFVNGTSKPNANNAGSIPYGVYTVRGYIPTSQFAMTIFDSTGSSGWKFPINNMYDSRAGRVRTGIMIHPDGNLPGTAGCFGILGSVATLNECRDNIIKVVKANGGSCKLEYLKKG